jgi:calcineurin-like phosphoesterase family protein
MSVFFTSDTHFGHRFVAETRGFDKTADHDMTIAENLIEVVKRDDVLWILGDLCLSAPDHALNLLNRLPGRKHLIWGNHDQGHGMHRDSFRRQAKYLGTFESVHEYIRRRINGVEVLMSHMPYAEGEEPDHGPTRYTQYRLPDEGKTLLHGHTHSQRQYTLSAKNTPQVHVGLDAWGLRPVPLDMIQEMIV